MLKWYKLSTKENIQVFERYPFHLFPLGLGIWLQQFEFLKALIMRWVGYQLSKMPDTKQNRFFKISTPERDIYIYT